MPIYAGVGISKNRDYKLAVSEAISQARTNLKEEEISLAVVFSSPEFAFPYLLKTINNLIGPNIPLIGATSSAIFTGDSITHQGIAVALMRIKEADFNIALTADAQKNLLFRGEDLGRNLLSNMEGILRRFALIFSDGKITEPSLFLKGLQQRLGLSFPVIGATSSYKNLSSPKTYQYFNYKVLSNSVVGILWSGKVNFGIGVRHGWRPLGKPHTVSFCSESTIREIENRPAVCLYEDYFAKERNELRKDLNYVSYLYPLGIKIPGEKEYLLRSILSLGDDGSLICRGNIPQNSQVRLMIATKESIFSATQEAIKEAKQATESPLKSGIVFVFNSLSRAYLLGRRASEELEIIKSEFLDLPIIGLYTYGEQAPLKAIGFRGQTYSYNQTIIILVMN